MLTMLGVVVVDIEQRSGHCGRRQRCEEECEWCHGSVW